MLLSKPETLILPYPMITSFEPVESFNPISITIYGKNFTNERIPTYTSLIGSSIREGVIDTYTSDIIRINFNSVGSGTYTVFIGFSDGSGCSKHGFVVTIREVK